MPKIIENLKDRLLAEAKQQIEQDGYQSVTIRSIAKGCGVGVGTVYNYFPAKETLVAKYLLEDWQECITALGAVSACADSPRQVALCIYDQLNAFADRHGAIFQDAAATAGFAGSFSQYHALLRTQLSQFLRRFCGSDFAAEFVAESLLVWTMAGKSFDEIYGILEKLFSGAVSL